MHIARGPLALIAFTTLMGLVTAHAADPQRLPQIVVLGQPDERVPKASNLVRGITALAWQPNGDAIVAGDETGRVTVWAIKPARTIAELPAPKLSPPPNRPIAHIAFHSDGRIAVAHAQQFVRIWNPTQPEARTIVTTDFAKRMPAQSELINGLAFRPNNQLAIAIGSDVYTVNEQGQAQGTAKMMPSLIGDPQKGFYRGQSAIALGTPGAPVAVGVAFYEGHDFDEVRSWDLLANKPIATAKLAENAQMVPLAVSPDGRWVLGIDFRNQDGRQVRFLDTTTLTQLAAFVIGKGKHESELIVPFSPDGRFFALSADGVSYTIYDVVRLAPIGMVRPAESSITAVAFAPNNRRIAVGTADSRIVLHDLRAVVDPQPPQSLTPAEAETLWTELASLDAVVGARAVYRLADHPSVSLAKLREKLQPIRKPNAEELAKLVAELDAPSFTVRETAKKKLLSIADAAEGELRQAASTAESKAVSQAINGVLEAMYKSRRRVEGERLRQFRGVQVLEAIASSESRELLRSLASGAPSATLTQEAILAMRR